MVECHGRCKGKWLGSWAASRSPGARRSARARGRQANKGRQTLAFYSMPEYEAWREAAGAGWSIKYYKGLGTSTEAEAKDYFADIDSHRKEFIWQGAPAPGAACRADRVTGFGCCDRGSGAAQKIAWYVQRQMIPWSQCKSNAAAVFTPVGV